MAGCKLLFGSVMLLYPGLVLAQGPPAPTTGYSSVVAHCEELKSYTGIQEAPTVVDGARFNPANLTYPHPAYCEVNVTIDTYTNVVYRFPAEGKDWSGIFTSQGCGGPCGYIRMDDQGAGPDTTGTSWSKDYLNKGFVVSFTNMGYWNSDYKYIGDGKDNFQALNNRTTALNWGHRSTHYLAIIGKDLTQVYYGAKPRLSIFKGGSTGGRQALNIAQRYPADYDHIIGAYPAMNETGIGLFQSSHWATANRNPADGCPYIRTSDLPQLFKAVMESCDKADGVKDNVISYPDTCKIDWDLIRCGSRKSLFNSTACFSQAKIDAAKRVYAPPKDENGKPWFPSLLPGTELGWTSLATENCYPNYYWNHTIDFVRNVAFETNDTKPDDWTPLDVDYAKDIRLAAYMEQTFYAGTNTDMKNFRNNGGKFLFMQGLADPSVTAGWTIEYYEQLQKLYGEDDLNKWMRLFVNPGQYHSWGSGTGASANMDLYTVLLKWVDQGIAPEMIKARHIETGNNFERPVYKWPYMAQYVSGDPAAATSFKPKRRNQKFKW